MPKMIEGGQLTPDCNFELIWSEYEANSIKSKDDLFKILKDFLWENGSKDKETYAMFDLNIINKEGDSFSEKLIDKGLLIPDPTKKQPIQIIQEHTLEDASYNFDYIDKKSPLNIEYQTYDNQKFLNQILQKGKNCDFSLQGDGGTQDQYLTLRFLNKKGKIESVKSSEFASLPLEITDDSDKEDIKNLKTVAQKFFDKIKVSI
jgi:hypothetical protein